MFGAGLIISALVPVIAFSQSPPTVNLHSAANFALLGGSTITNTGPTTVTGDIGLFSGSAITGFPPGIVIGTTHIDTTAARAQADLTIAYNDAAGRTLAPVTVSGNIGGLTLTPGLYKSQTTLAISSGDLTLDAQGDANGVWIFQIGSALTTTSDRKIVLKGGAQAKNIFWQVGTSATLGTTSIFYGNILAAQSITINTGATVNGRALAQSGQVSCASSTVTMPGQSAAKTAILSTNSRNVNVGSTHVDSMSWTLITLINTGTDTLRFVTATSTNTAFSSHLSALLIAPGASIIDSIKFHPTTMGADSGKLVFVSNATTSPDTIAVHGSGVNSAKSAILATDSRNVNCGTTQVGTPTWTLLTLSNTGTDTLRFTMATSTNPAFTSHLTALLVAPGASIIDTIKFLPTTVGASTGKLIFTSNATTSPDTIGVSGIAASGAKSAILFTSSRNVNVGSTKIGKPAWMIVTLSNTGNDTLRISTATSTNSVFSSHLSGFVIPPGESILDSIEFVPTMLGPDSGKLVFIGNAITSPDTIGVHGIGTMPSAVNEGASPASYTLGAMYPNPVSDATQLQVRLQSGERLLDAAMYDMLGRELQDWTSRIAPSGSLALHLGSYPVGEYIVRLLTTARMQVLPVVIVK